MRRLATLLCSAAIGMFAMSTAFADDPGGDAAAGETCSTVECKEDASPNAARLAGAQIDKPSADGDSTQATDESSTAAGEEANP